MEAVSKNYIIPKISQLFQDNLILFNLSYVLRHLATNTLRDEKSGLEEVVSAVRNLELAQRFFTMLR